MTTPAAEVEPAAAVEALPATPVPEDGPAEDRIIVCPSCGACVWAKRDGLRLLCLDCGQQMKYV